MIENAPYFFEQIHKLAEEEYIPTEEDLLKCRDRTTGVFYENLLFEGHQFQLFDVVKKKKKESFLHPLGFFI